MTETSSRSLLNTVDGELPGPASWLGSLRRDLFWPGFAGVMLAWLYVRFLDGVAGRDGGAPIVPFARCSSISGVFDDDDDDAEREPGKSH